MQETHTTKSIEKRWKTEWGGKVYFSHGTLAARGVAILMKRNTNIKIHNCTRDEEGRFLILDITQENNRMSLVNVFGPNTDSPAFYMKLT